MEWVANFLNELWGITVEMSPYLLLGFLFAGILKVWFPQRWIDRFMGKNNMASVFNTALLGIPLPLCSCGVIPTGVSFYRNGASKGSSVSFLISTPQTGVDSILVTYSMLGLPFAIIRVVVALITGMLGGLLTNVLDKTIDPSAQKDKKGQTPTGKHSVNPFFKIFQYGFYEFLMDIAKWLVVGLLIAAALAVIIPDDFFTLYLTNDWLSMLLVLVASVPLYICATASVPIAAVLMLKGLAPGAALVLLMAGPATNAATITVLNKVFGKRTLLAYLLSIIGGALFFGFLINTFLPREWFTLSEHVMHHGQHNHQILPGWLQLASAILMIGLIVNGYILRWFKNRQTFVSSKVAQPQSVLFDAGVGKTNFATPVFTMPLMEQGTIIEVKGMTCNHCKASVENNLSKIDGITKVSANPQTNRVVISGKNINLNEISKIIEQLGYQYNGKV